MSGVTRARWLTPCQRGNGRVASCAAAVAASTLLTVAITSTSGCGKPGNGAAAAGSCSRDVRGSGIHRRRLECHVCSPPAMSAVDAAPARATLTAEHAVDPVGTLSLLRHGDPCSRRDGATLWWATRTPHGPATLHIARQQLRTVHAQAWGDGAERLAGSGMPPEEVRTRLVAELPGVGVWTAAEATSRALGDEDAVSLGDYNLFKHVGFALTGRPARDDAEMLRLLEPWAGRRGLAALLLVSGVRMPRRGPRLPLRDFRQE